MTLNSSFKSSKGDYNKPARVVSFCEPIMLYDASVAAQSLLEASKMASGRGKKLRRKYATFHPRKLNQKIAASLAMGSLNPKSGGKNNGTS